MHFQRWQRFFPTACAIFFVPTVWLTGVAHADTAPSNSSSELPPIEKLKLQLEQRSVTSSMPGDKQAYPPTTLVPQAVPAPQLPAPALASVQPQKPFFGWLLVLLLLSGAGGCLLLAKHIFRKLQSRSLEPLGPPETNVADLEPVAPLLIEDQPEAAPVLPSPPPFSLSEGVGFLQTGNLAGWNGWRALHPGQTICLSKRDFSGKTLSGFNLARVNLSEANLDRADLSNADLSHANLHSARLNGAKLLSANLTATDCRRASLQGADLSFADLSYAALNEANLTSAQLKQTNLSHARLINANLSHAFAKWAVLQSTVLTQAIAQRTNFEVAKLVDVVLHRADLSHADFRCALLHRVQAEGANFAQTDFLGSQIDDFQCDEWTNLSGTVLEQAEPTAPVIPVALATPENSVPVAWFLSQVRDLKYPTISPVQETA